MKVCFWQNLSVANLDQMPQHLVMFCFTVAAGFGWLVVIEISDSTIIDFILFRIMFVLKRSVGRVLYSIELG